MWYLLHWTHLVIIAKVVCACSRSFWHTELEGSGSSETLLVPLTNKKKPRLAKTTTSWFDFALSG